MPEALIKKRQAAMSATLRKRQRASDYASPGYQFQGMALTYKRPLPAMVKRRSTRPTQPTVAAREAVSQRPERRVRFTPSTLPETQPTTNHATPIDDPLTTPSLTENERPGNQEKYPYTAQLPQSFPHGLPVGFRLPLGCTEYL